MGTILFPGGAAFRVWAPFADSVSVAGDFNEWNTEADFFSSEGNGFWSVEVTGVEAGHQYKFVIRNGGKLLWKRNPYGSEVSSRTGNGVIHDPEFDWSGDDFTMPPHNELVIYEMHVGSFYDPDDGPSRGTFQSILPKLPYLQGLGINAIEILPIEEFPGDDSWGYNPSQPFSVESSLGGPQGLHHFVKAAHAHGIAVILDVVYNHIGTDDNDLWQFDGWTDDRHPGGIYFYDRPRIESGFGDRPDYGRGEVRQYLRDNMLFWLNKYRLDGLRFDSTVNIRRNKNGGDIGDGWSLMQWMNNEVRRTQPWKITIAEDLQDNEWMTKDTGAGGAGFSTQWATSFTHAIRDAIVTADDRHRDMHAVRRALEFKYNGIGTQRVHYTESHDEVAKPDSPRVPERIWGGNADSRFSRKRSTLGAAMVFTAPGIPMIFQGQEFLEDRYWQGNVPLDWSKVERHRGIVQMYTDLIKLRRNWQNNTRGLRGDLIHVHHVNSDDKVIAFHRWENGGPGDDVIVAANFADRSYDSYEIGFPRRGLWRVRFNSDAAAYGSDFGNKAGYDTFASDGDRDNMPARGNVGIGPYSVLILSQDS